ncbi:hypothetical protein A45J_2380 [hot springs metagenome]|uniref:Uncharacterized protein n=1 Tax=hot springs metagenome TaxID=433727 RepID=A0A5J4LAN4_9ZZZZ
MNRHIIIASSFIKPERLKPYLTKNMICLYAGEDIRRFESFRNSLSNHIEFIHPSKFHNFVDSKRKDFVEWTEKIHMQYGSNYAHWIKDVFSSNPYNSKLFLYFMNLLWLKSVIGNFTNRDILFISENYAAMRIAEKIAYSISGGKVLTLGFFNGIVHLGYKMSINIFKALARVLFFTIRYLISVVSRIMKTDKNMGDPVVMIDTYILNGSFEKDAIFKSRYFSEVYDYLKRQDICVAFLPAILDRSPWKLWSIFKNMRISNTRFILLEDYIRLSDVIDLFLFPFRLLMNMEHVPDFCGIEVQTLVDEENWLNLFSFSYILQVLIHKMPKNLHNAGFSPKLYINWSENQTFSRALILGFHKYIPNVRVIGGKPFIPPLNHLNLFNTTSERLWGVAPDKIVTCGPKLKSLFSHNDKDGIYSVGASLRYGYLWDIVTGSNNSINAKNIAILLPYSNKISRYILHLSSNAIINALDKGYNIIIKGHTTHKKNDLISMLYKAGLENMRLSIVYDDMKSVLLSSKVVITSASSVTCEAICLGIPVVLIGLPVGLDLNMNDVVPDSMWRMAYTKEDVDIYVNQWALNHPFLREERRKVGREVLESIFMPNSEEFIKEYLN